MKFKVDSNELGRKLNALLPVVGKNPVLPILEDILFTLNKNTLTLTATDLEMFMQVEIEVQGEEDGSIAIPAKTIATTIKGLHNQTLEFELSNELMKITSAFGSYEITGELAEDFPRVPDLEDLGAKNIVSTTDLLNAIEKTIFCTATDELRPALTGILFTSMELVATDAHKLSRVQLSLNLQEKEFIIPAKVLSLLKSIFRVEDLEIMVAKNHISFSGDSYTLIGRIIDAKFPDYKSILPNNEKQVQVVRQDLLNSLKRVALFANMATTAVVLDIKEDEIIISAEDLDF